MKESYFIFILVFVLCLTQASAVVSTFDEINYTSDYNLILVADGDSITAAANNHAIQLRNLSGYFGKARFKDIAIPSLTADQIRAKYQADIAGYKPLSINDEGYYIVYAGINDIMFSQSADSTYSELKDIWAQARADGFKVVAFTLAPTVFTQTIGTNAQELVKLNQLIASDASLYDYLVRPEFLISDYNNPVYYLPDQVHWTNESYRQVAMMIRNQIESAPYQLSSSNSSNCSGLNCQNLILNPAGKRVYVGGRGTQLTSTLNVFENTSTDSHSGISIEQIGKGDAKINLILKNLITYTFGVDNLGLGLSTFKLVAGTNLSSNVILEASYPGAAFVKIGGNFGPSKLLVSANDPSPIGSGITIQQTGIGDSRLEFVADNKMWAIGIDNSDDDKLKIGSGRKLGLEGATALEVSQSSNILIPLGNLTISALNGTYAGGSAFVCVNNSGTLFASELACP
jgi:lysophospholipase L1-like esterase